MENGINIDKTFEKEHFVNTRINHREFEDCSFKNCDFSNSDFSNNTFMNCEFIDCNLSMTQLIGTSLKKVFSKTASYWVFNFMLVTIFYLKLNFKILL